MKPENPVADQVKSLLAEAIRQRAIPFRVFCLRVLEGGEVFTRAISAAHVRMSEHEHLIFVAKDQSIIRIDAPGTWYGVRDVTAEGSEAVTSFLASFEPQGAGTA